MKVEKIKRLLIKECQYIFEYLTLLGGKFGLYNREYLVNDIVQDYNIDRAIIEEDLDDLIEYKLLFENKVNNKKFVFFSSRMFKELFNVKNNVLFPDSFYAYDLWDMKYKYIRMVSNGNQINKKDLIKRLSYSNIFDLSNTKIEKLENAYKIKLDRAFKSLGNYNISFMQENNNSIWFSFFIIDKDNFSIQKHLKHNYKEIINKVKEVGYSLNENKKITLSIVMPKEHKDYYANFFIKVLNNQLNEYASLKNVTVQYNFV